jgi:hypothetical protein
MRIEVPLWLLRNTEDGATCLSGHRLESG